MPHVAACAINLERVTQFAGNANGMATGGRSATCESVRRISSLACGFVSDRSMDICFSSEKHDKSKLRKTQCSAELPRNHRHHARGSIHAAATRTIPDRLATLAE